MATNKIYEEKKDAVMLPDDEDIFDDITMAEERFQRQGYVDGRKRGQETGYDEGFRLGCQHGATLGAELGFYSGFTSTLKNLLEKEEVLKPRKVKAVTSLLTLIDDFPMDDAENPNLQEKIQDVRAKFKQVCSLLNVNPDFKSASASTGISF